MFWHDKKVLVTGGNGFLGRFVVEKLRQGNCKNIIVPRSRDYNLTKESEVCNLFRDYKDIDLVIHLAADAGGIGYNTKNPGSILYNNLMMNTLIMEYSRINKVKKFIGVGSVCSYPKFTEIPFKEEDLWNGYPEETNAPYGLSKKIMMEQGIAYRKEYNFNAVHLLMINLYGPGDNFDLHKSHVIPALIKKFTEAKRSKSNEVIVWGDGSATREFIYVEDAAEAILLASEKYNKELPVNIGSGMEISIRDIVKIISSLVGYTGEIIWDKSKPNGQPRRKLDISKAKEEFGFEAKTDFKEGLKEVIKYSLANC